MPRTIAISEPILACHNILGEGCLWDADAKLLYWIDIKKSEVHALDPKTMAHTIDEYAGKESLITAIALRKDQPGLIASHKTHLAYLPSPTHPTKAATTVRTDRSSESVPIGAGTVVPEKYTKEGKDGHGTERFNDGAADASGRLWIGTMGWVEPNMRGQLYKYEAGGELELVEEEVGVSNGLGWSPDNKIMYYIDSPKEAIFAYDFDLSSGTLSNKRVFADNKPYSQGTFDGLCMDAEGAVWAARWGDSKVVRYLPSGEVDCVVELPGVLHVTCCVFGGDDLEDLFITTACASCTEPEKKPLYPQGGDLFKVNVGVRGVERFKFSG